MNELEYKAYGTKVALSEDGTFTAVVSVYDVIDSYGERVKSTAFDASLERYKSRGKAVKILWGHNWERPVGIATELESMAAGDERLPDEAKQYGGLVATGKLALNTKEGAEAYEHLKAGTIDEFSIGYRVVKDSFGDDGLRDLDEVDLHEFSLVLVGANPATSLMALKSNMTQPQKAEALDTEIMAFVESLGHHADMREKAGRVLSAANMAVLQQLANNLGKARKEILRIITAATPQPKDEPKKLSAKEARTYLIKQGIK
jgi:hypothetical protein